MGVGTEENVLKLFMHHAYIYIYLYIYIYIYMHIYQFA